MAGAPMLLAALILASGAFVVHASGATRARSPGDALLTSSVAPTQDTVPPTITLLKGSNIVYTATTDAATVKIDLRKLATFSDDLDPSCASCTLTVNSVPVPDIANPITDPIPLVVDSTGNRAATIWIRLQDAQQNLSPSAAITFTWVDTTPPTIALAACTTTFDATSAAGASVPFASCYTAADAISGSAWPLLTCTAKTDGLLRSVTSPATLPIGTTVVACAAVDRAGNTSPALSVTFTVADTIPPMFTQVGCVAVARQQPAYTGCVANVGLDAATRIRGVAGAYFSPTSITLTAVDSGAGVPVTCVLSTKARFTPGAKTPVFVPVGIATATCTAQDAAGNRATTTFQIAVTDHPPVVPPYPNSFSFVGSCNDNIDECDSQRMEWCLLGPTTSLLGSSTSSRDPASSFTFAPVFEDAVDGPLTSRCTRADGAVLLPTDCLLKGVHAVTCTATDLSGLTSAVAFTIEVTVPR